MSKAIDTAFPKLKANHLNVVVQVNSQAKSPGLAEWAKKNSTHSKLATAAFDTNATDKEAELSRVMELLREQAKGNLK